MQNTNHTTSNRVLNTGITLLIAIPVMAVILLVLYCNTFTAIKKTFYITDEVEHVYPFRSDQIELDNGETFHSDNASFFYLIGDSKKVHTGEYITEVNIFGYTRNIEDVAKRERVK